MNKQRKYLLNHYLPVPDGGGGGGIIIGGPLGQPGSGICITPPGNNLDSQLSFFTSEISFLSSVTIVTFCGFGMALLNKSASGRVTL